MRIAPRLGSLLVSAPAKINLFLELHGKRDDGYHEIATLMVALSLRDTLFFTDDPSGDVTLTCDSPKLSTGPDNLIVKAAHLLKRAAGAECGARIRLRKRIPMAAGLAGGSTDAAATLLALNRLWNVGLSSAELATLSSQLGSDIPFFFALPAAWCTGRGEIVQPVAAPKPLDVVLIFPPFGCDTASVYRNVILGGSVQTGDTARQSLAAGDVDRLARNGLFNRLTPAATRVAPQLEGLLDAVQRVHEWGCQMSGSGSTLYALAEDGPAALELAAKLRALPALKECGVKVVRTLAGSVSNRPGAD